MAAMCDTCHAGCCRGYNLLITAFDALRLSHDLSLPMGEFSTLLSLSVDQARRFEKNFIPVRLADPGCEQKRFFLALKRIESRLVPGTVKCYFLNEWQREHAAPDREGHAGQKVVARCSIYNSRPMMCRTYPTALHANVALGFITTPRPIDLSDKNPMYQLCPEKWTAESFSTDHTTVLHNLVINQFENDFYNQAVAEFNRKSRTARDFFPFMADVYKNRFRTAPALLSKAPEPSPSEAAVAQN